MTSSPTTPSWKRAGLAVLIIAATAIIASLIRISRADFNLLPELIVLDCYGTSTNFFVCLACPFVAFVFPETIDFTSFAKVTFGHAVGLTIYEFIQLIMPARTFDWYDILASFIGMLFSLGLAKVVFFR